METSEWFLDLTDYFQDVIEHLKAFHRAKQFLGQSLLRGCRWPCFADFAFDLFAETIQHSEAAISH